MGKVSELSYHRLCMIALKILIGLLALLIAWAYIFHNKLIFQINAWMRKTVFSDEMVLFSGRRVAVLLFVLGCVALFSGLQNMIQTQPIKPNIAAQMLEQAREDFRNKKYNYVVNRCVVLVRSNPNSVEAWELLATTWWTMGEKKKARQTVQLLLRLQPNHPFGKRSFEPEVEKDEKEKK